MPNEVAIDGKKLILSGKSLSFKFNIAQVYSVEDFFVVLLDIPDDITGKNDNIYAITGSGKPKWKVHVNSGINPEITLKSPFVGMSFLENGNISATSFYGINYEISVKDGSLLSSRLVK